MNVASDSFTNAVNRSCDIHNLEEWLQRQRIADYPDSHWDHADKGLLGLSEIEDAMSGFCDAALEKYAAPTTASELKNMGVDHALVIMAGTYIAGGARVYPVSNGIAVVFRGDRFLAVFFDGHDEQYRSTEDAWEVLYCILGTWRSGPTKEQSEQARKFLCDLVEKVMRAEAVSA